MTSDDALLEDGRNRRAALSIAQAQIYAGNGNTWRQHADDAYQWLTAGHPAPAGSWLSDALSRIEQIQEKIMTAQDDITAQAATITADAEAITAAVASLQAEISSLQSQGVDTSGLDAAVASLGTALSGLQALPGAAASGTSPDSSDASTDSSEPAAS